MSREAAANVERRLQLLELEAAVQRATLEATFARYGERPALAMGSAVGAGVVRLLAVPQIRWIVIASVLSRLRRRHERRRGE